MNKEEISKEKYYINGEFFYNIDIENEIKKYIKHIDIFVTKEFDTIYAKGTYQNVHCQIQLEEYYLYHDYNNFLQHVALDIYHLISKEYFLKEVENERAS